MEHVILVDEQDRELGTMEKMEAHVKAVLHRAFSVFIFNSTGDMLLQQRAWNKYHSGGLWTNSCCSHPRPGETILTAATRRLKEEMGFETPLHIVFDFVYKAPFGNGLTEHEYDHVLVGYYDGVILPDAGEVAQYAYRSMDQIADTLCKNPEAFTVWFQLAYSKVREWWQQQQPQ